MSLNIKDRKIKIMLVIETTSTATKQYNVTDLHYNGLSCPYCCNRLYDSLFDLELNKENKTVKCSNNHCDYLAIRVGFVLHRLGK